MLAARYLWMALIINLPQRLSAMSEAVLQIFLSILILFSICQFPFWCTWILSFNCWFYFKLFFWIIFLLAFERYFLFWKANALYLSINKSFVLCNSEEHHYVEYKKCIKDTQCINVWILTEWLHIKQTILNRR